MARNYLPRRHKRRFKVPKLSWRLTASALAVVGLAGVSAFIFSKAHAAPPCELINEKSDSGLFTSNKVFDSPASSRSWDDTNGYHYEVHAFGLLTQSSQPGDNRVWLSTQCGSGQAGEKEDTSASGSLGWNGQAPVDVYLGVPKINAPNGGLWQNPNAAIPPVPKSGTRPPLFQKNFSSSAGNIDDAGMAGILSQRYSGLTRIYCMDMPSVDFRGNTGPMNGCGDINTDPGTGFVMSLNNCNMNNVHDADGSGPWNCYNPGVSGVVHDVNWWYLNSQNVNRNMYKPLNGGNGDGSHSPQEISLANMIGCKGNNDCNGTSDNLNSFSLFTASKNTQAINSDSLVLLTFKYRIPPRWVYTPQILALDRPDGANIAPGQTQRLQLNAKNFSLTQDGDKTFHIDLKRSTTGRLGVYSPVTSYPSTGNYAPLPRNTSGPSTPPVYQFTPTGGDVGKTVCFQDLTDFWSDSNNPGPSVTPSNSICYNVVSPTSPYLNVIGGDITASGYKVLCAQNHPILPSPDNFGRVQGQPGVGSTVTYVISAGDSAIGNFHSGNGSNNLNLFNYGQVCMPDLAGPSGAAQNYKNLHGSTPVSGIFNPGTPSPATDSGKLYESSGSLTITTGTVHTRYTIYVHGDVTITGPIGYGGDSGRSSTPSFGVIATGNINIAPSVQSLVGFYFAHDTTGLWRSNVGQIHTGSGNAHLLLTGLLMGDNLHFERTYGDSVTNTPPGPAEQATADARLYISPPPAFSDVLTSDGGSPLDNGDLPPLF